MLETDPAHARAVAREGVSVYLQLPNYVNNWRRLGFTEDDFADGGSDRLVDHVVVWGDEATIATRVQAHLDAGADHVCVQAMHRSGANRLPQGRMAGTRTCPGGSHTKVTMDIEQFYDADPRRRESEEIEFGREWSDAKGMRTELSWVAATGELYAMAEPSEPVFMDPVGDTRVPDLPTELVTVEVLGVISDRAQLDRVLDGWEQAMGTTNSIQWVRDRITQVG